MTSLPSKSSRSLLGRWLRCATATALIACGDPSEAARSEGAEAASSAADVAPSASADAGGGVASKVSAEATAAPSATTPGCPSDWPCDGPAPAGAAGDLILVDKSEHRLWLFSGREVIESHSVALGSGGQGQKGYEGDKVTPIGSYQVTHIIPKTRWHTYLALDYPREEDKRRYAELVARGEAPPGTTAGSGIAIHGRRADMPDGAHKLIDWTLGCVALDNAEIDAIAGKIKKGARVVIRA